VNRPVVTLYVTGDCHLCEEAERLLRRLAREIAFLELVDISSDAPLRSPAAPAWPWMATVFRRR
jgi:hypothetical protein